MNTSPIFSVVLLVCVFFIITYVISIFEKITDWKGTLAFMKMHFEKTPLKKTFIFGLYLLIFTEIICCIFLFLGGYHFITTRDTWAIQFGLICSAIALLEMLIGQRFAKDYPGAMNLNIYFIINILGLICLEFILQ